MIFIKHTQSRGKAISVVLTMLVSKRNLKVYFINLSSFSFSKPSSPAPDIGTGEVRTFDHEKLQFLKDGHRKDKSGRLHTDPYYDKRTLLVSSYVF